MNDATIIWAVTISAAVAVVVYVIWSNRHDHEQRDRKYDQQNMLLEIQRDLNQQQTIAALNKEAGDARQDAASAIERAARAEEHLGAARKEAVSANERAAPPPTLPTTRLQIFLSGKWNIRVYFLGSDDFPREAKMQAALDINSTLEAGWTGFEIGERIPLAEIARAHELVDHRSRRGRVAVILRPKYSGRSRCLAFEAKLHLSGFGVNQALACEY